MLIKIKSTFVRVHEEIRSLALNVSVNYLHVRQRVSIAIIAILLLERYDIETRAKLDRDD